MTGRLLLDDQGFSMTGNRMANSLPCPGPALAAVTQREPESTRL
jgi:hypothetical protein